MGPVIHRALIIVAHGSRRASSNDEVMRLGQKVKDAKAKEFALVLTSFLEFANPSLEESILESIEKGVGEVVILPYFLASGNHVTRDIPEIIQKVQTSHPDVTLTLKEHLGSAAGMVQLLSQMAE